MRNQRIRELRSLMKERGIDIYIIPTSDYHQSEYISDYFKVRQFITGFTGSAGTAVVTMEEACLWTDGRYYIQAEKELQGCEFKLYKMGMDKVPTVREYMKEYISRHAEKYNKCIENDVINNVENHTGQSSSPKICIGFDGQVLCARDGVDYERLAEENHACIYCEEDLIDTLWDNRPPFPTSQAYVLEEQYSGKSTADKLREVREHMNKQKADIHVLSDVCDIAWLLNIRGDDIRHVPVILSCLLMDMDKCCWYVKKENLNQKVLEYLSDNHIEVREYNCIYQDLHKIKGKKLLADLGRINYRMKSSINTELIDAVNPEQLLKAVKNPTEVENIKAAHIKDGVAVTKFMYWLKHTIGTQTITEMDAAKKINQLRSEQEHYIDISFDTIAAYGENAAMMHYEADESCNAILEPKGFLLVDSGGHYLEGSTDITRTFALGELSKEEQKMFTAVVRSNLNLAAAKFLYGCTGENLDILAREPLWELGVDYRCGTGHGNGYLLNVHEGPNSFRWRIQENIPRAAVFEEGMITTDEPGVYEEGKYGIRIENELLCKKGIKNDYGQFMEFETITYAPIDLDAINVEEMTLKEKNNLNDYHKKVYETISPYLSEDEREWLKDITRKV